MVRTEDNCMLPHPSQKVLDFEDDRDLVAMFDNARTASQRDAVARIARQRLQARSHRMGTTRSRRMGVLRASLTSLIQG